MAQGAKRKRRRVARFRLTSPAEASTSGCMALLFGLLAAALTPIAVRARLARRGAISKRADRGGSRLPGDEEPGRAARQADWSGHFLGSERGSGADGEDTTRGAGIGRA